jgi:hypothetical protein
MPIRRCLLQITRDFLVQVAVQVALLPQFSHRQKSTAAYGCINLLAAIIVFYGQPAPGFGGAHAPIGAGVLEMVMPMRGGSAHAASSSSVATRSNLIRCGAG